MAQKTARKYKEKPIKKREQKKNLVDLEPAG